MKRARETVLNIPSGLRLETMIRSVHPSGGCGLEVLYHNVCPARSAAAAQETGALLNNCKQVKSKMTNSSSADSLRYGLISMRGSKSLLSTAVHQIHD